MSIINNTPYEVVVNIHSGIANNLIPRLKHSLEENEIIQTLNIKPGNTSALESNGKSIGYATIRYIIGSTDVETWKGYITLNTRVPYSISSGGGQNKTLMLLHGGDLVVNICNAKGNYKDFSSKESVSLLDSLYDNKVILFIVVAISIIVGMIMTRRK